MTRRAALTAAAVAALAAPFALSGYWLYVVNLGLVYAIVAGSLVVLTGWAGQISLAQASFMGISAYTVVALYHHFDVPFLVGAPIAVLATIPLTLLVGLVALRLSGFYLAAATVAFALAVQRFVFQIRDLTGGSSGFPAPPLRVLGWDLGSGPSFFFVVAGTATLLVAGTLRLRSSRVGRAWAAIRTSERAARSLGIDVSRYKVGAFVVSGLVAGVAGVLYAPLLGRLSPLSFDVGPSVLILSIALLGGIDHLAGALVGGMAYAFTPELARTLGVSGNWVPFLLAAAMVVVIAAFPGGVVGALTRAPRTGNGAHTDDFDLAALDALAARWGDRPAPPVLALVDVTVRFGGVTALDRLSLVVAPGTIVGLIGPNGAGKTTCFNVLTGFVPTNEGAVTFDDRVLTGAPPEQRAAAGLARTFQTPLLFSSETVEQNLLMAAHLHPDGDPGPEAGVVLRALGLGGVARHRVDTLPFGMKRLVELARCLMARPAVLLLDEPAAGLSNEETLRLARLVAALRDRLGLSVVLIEHDVDLVLSLADRVEVLDFGRRIATGTPEEIQADAAVQRAYLGLEGEDALDGGEVARVGG